MVLEISKIWKDEQAQDWERKKLSSSHKNNLMGGHLGGSVC